MDSAWLRKRVSRSVTDQHTVYIFLCSSPIFSVENRTSENVRTFFLFFTDVFTGKQELFSEKHEQLAEKVGD